MRSEIREYGGVTDRYLIIRTLALIAAYYEEFGRMEACMRLSGGSFSCNSLPRLLIAGTALSKLLLSK